MQNPTTTSTTDPRRALPKTRPCPTPRPLTSRSLLVGVLLALGGALSSAPAHAQIVREKPGQVKAANRRALREAKHTESPYKDSHLDVTRDRLKRGQSVPLQQPNNNDLNYKTGTAPNVKSSSYLGLRRKKGA